MAEPRFNSRASDAIASVFHHCALWAATKIHKNVYLKIKQNP